VTRPPVRPTSRRGRARNGRAAREMRAAASGVIDANATTAAAALNVATTVYPDRTADLVCDNPAHADRTLIATFIAMTDGSYRVHLHNGLEECDDEGGRLNLPCRQQLADGQSCERSPEISQATIRKMLAGE